MHQVSARPRPAGARVYRLAPVFWAALIAAVFYICFFSHLAALGLVGPDEPRYASVAREMAESGDWVTPRLDGRPWFEKPALYYWSAALAFRAFGVNESAARLPSALAAALAGLALAWAARRFYGCATSRAVLLIFPTSVGVFGFARAATPDMLFSAALAAAMLAAAPATPDEPEQKRTGAASRVAFGAFLGAATLAKGPAAIALAAGSLGLWALATRRWRVTLRWAHPLAIAAFCIVALPWYVLCAARNPGFIRTFLFKHNFERYLTPIFRHEQPFWFFVPILILGLLPWTVLLAGVARHAARAWRQKRWADSPGFFFACWAFFPVVFFSFSKSKLPGYVLPALPPLTLLLARTVDRAFKNEDRLVRSLCGVLGATFVVLAASAGYWLRRLPPESGLDAHRLLGWILLAAVGGLAIAALGLTRLPGAALLAATVLMAVMVEGANRRALPQLDAYVSARAAARAGQARAADSLSVYRLRRAWRYGLNFYLHRELPEWSPQSSLPGWVYTTAAGLAELERQGVGVAVAERASPQAWLVRVFSLPEASGTRRALIETEKRRHSGA